MQCSFAVGSTKEVQVVDAFIACSYAGTGVFAVVFVLDCLLPNDVVALGEKQASQAAMSVVVCTSLNTQCCHDATVVRCVVTS